MSPQEIVLFVGIAGVVGPLVARIGIWRLVRDHTARRRLYPKVNWALGAGGAVVSGVFFSRVITTSGLPREMQVAAVAIGVVILLAVFGFGDDERSTQP